MKPVPYLTGGCGMAELILVIGGSVMWYQSIKAAAEGAAIVRSSETGGLEYASDTTITCEEVASDIGEVFGEVLSACDIPMQVCNY